MFKATKSFECEGECKRLNKKLIIKIGEEMLTINRWNPTKMHNKV